MTPAAFVEEVRELARKEDFQIENLVLGGDHIGPYPWRNLDYGVAMENAEELVRAYVEAGFTKIHIDTSMCLAGDDRIGGTGLELIAERSARLASVVYKTFNKSRATHAKAVRPVLVVGSEVPVPGGSVVYEDRVSPTKAEVFNQSVCVFRESFDRMQVPWDDVVAFVVQPGVEFGDDFIIPYSRESASELCAQLKDHAGMVFEGHSTDYQPLKCLRDMVIDGIKILKVGPELTFTLREALLQLLHIERILDGSQDGQNETDILKALLDAMNKDTKNWESYYAGTPEEIEFKKIYSFSDRCRYYLNEAAVEKTIGNLIADLRKKKIPLALLSQYMPKQYEKIINGYLRPDVWDLVYDRIMDVLDRYLCACGGV